MFKTGFIHLQMEVIIQTENTPQENPSLQVGHYFPLAHCLLESSLINARIYSKQ